MFDLPLSHLLIDLFIGVQYAREVGGTIVHLMEVETAAWEAGGMVKSNPRDERVTMFPGVGPGSEMCSRVALLSG